MHIKNQKDFFAGLLFAGFGAFFTYFSMQYSMRTAANAGPGYFPFYLVVLTLLSVVINSSLASHEFSWKGTLLNALVLIGLCVVVFVWALKLQFQLWPAFIA